MASICTYERRLQQVRGPLQNDGYCSCPEQGHSEDLGRDWKAESTCHIRYMTKRVNIQYTVDVPLVREGTEEIARS